MTAPHGSLTRDPTAAVLPIWFFGVAVVAFAVAVSALPWLLGEAVDFFYQPHVLALTHVLTLGWISGTMQGVLYRYVPALTKQAMPHPRMARLQCAAFVAGTIVLIGGFWVHRWWPVVLAAAALALAALLLCANVWPMLRAAPRRGVAEAGLFASTGFFVVAAVVGTLLAADKTWSFLPGSVLVNLAVHVHVAALGWVGLTIVALSFRFLPAFLLPEFDPTVIGLRLVVALGAGIVALAAALVVERDVAWAVATALATLCGLYVVLVMRVVATRRMPMDWTAWHAIASVAWLAGAAVAGVAVAVTGGDDAVGARVAVAYGVAGILGWMSNLIIGVSYKLFPGFVAAARAQRGRRAVAVPALAVPAPIPALVFVAFNTGVAALVGGALAAAPLALRIGSTVLAGSGVLYAIATGRTLAMVVRDPGSVAALRPAG